MRKLILAGIGLFGTLALAQDAGSIPTDLGAWFASTASLAAVVAALVSLIRKHLWKTLDGLGVLGLSLALSVALAYLGARLGYLGGDWFTFGLGAFLIASGGTSYLKGLTQKGTNDAPATPVDTRLDARRSGLR